MKHNLTKLLNSKITGLKAGGVIDVNDLVNDLVLEIKFFERVTKQMLLWEYVKARTEIFLNQHDCYSYAKNKFVALDSAGVKQLMTIDGDFVKGIIGRAKTLKRIREREAANGQITAQFNGCDFVGYSEEKSIEELLRAVNE